MAELWQCKKSSLKSPSMTQGTAHTVTCLNSLVSKVAIIAWDTLGDRYTTAICKFSEFGSCMVADTASMPVFADLCALLELNWLGTQISTPPLFSFVILSHLTSI